MAAAIRRVAHFMNELRETPAAETSTYVPEPYSMQAAGRLLFTVNRLSQGGTDGVAKLIHYASARLEWRPDMVVVGDVIAGVRERVLRFVSNQAMHERIDMGSVDDQLQSQAEKLKLYAGTDPSDAEALLPDIARYVVKSDAHWLLAQKGRPRRGSDGQPSTDFHDAWLSHMCHFGINGNTTRHPLFDDMFRQIRARLFGTEKSREALMDWSGMRNLREVVALHNEHHPDDRVELPY